MPEPRFDPLGRRWVLLAPERARRGVPPMEVDDPDPGPCDFCAGQEDRTPPETLRIDAEGSWRVRAVPNLYPATAVHEVVVHTPEHEPRFEDLEPGHRTDVLRAYQLRIAATAPTAAIVVWNRGRRAGASRSHAHGQLFGLDRVPPTLARETEAFAASGCVLCDLAGEHRVGDMVSVHPVPLVSHELLIVPAHAPRFDTAGEDEIGAVAVEMARSLHALRTVFGDGVPFNVVVHTAPTGIERFHWHAHVYPRLNTWGGLEIGTELPIVAADPADAAVRLRSSRLG